MDEEVNKIDKSIDSLLSSINKFKEAVNELLENKTKTEE